MSALVSRDALKRLLACLAGSLVLAMMWGQQEGSNTDYGYGFRQAVLEPRVFTFLALGVLLFLALTYRSLLTPYLARPGALPLGAGALTVLASFVLLRWFDPLSSTSPKFGAVAKAVSQTSGLDWSTTAYFSWLHWALFIVAAVGAVVGIVTRISVVSWASAVVALVGALLSYTAHHALASFTHATDHSLGAGVAVIGFVVVAAAATTAALSARDVADGRAFVNKALAWRPGMPLAGLGLIVGLIAFVRAVWFSPSNYNSRFSYTHTQFAPTPISALTDAYLTWLGWTLFGLAVVLAAVGCYLRLVALAWTAAAVGFAGTVLTLMALYNISDVASRIKTTGLQGGVDGATGPWQNLGTGGWLATAAFFLLAGAGLVAVLAARRQNAGTGIAALVSSERGKSPKTSTQTLLLAGIAVALFYPPTAAPEWQSVLVTQVGVYVLLAVGLNVVVGWAGLLDLGFIAFYAIGSYITAYLTGSLPIDPPTWLRLSPLVAIPFAIVVCIIAGVILGAPTLRLRGDYLAIVTLGFGEIIHTSANLSTHITGGPQGTQTDPGNGVHPVPNPVIDLGPIKWQWGQAILQYWYLLLVLIVIVVVLFGRLENSRIGRAWAAIREDEVAAESTGINTFRIKLLAFAIGASTSGIAGVFYASLQTGFISPDAFVLQNSILVVAYVVFGGAGSLSGVMAGAAILTWLPNFLKDQVPQQDQYLWIGAILLLTMIFRPGGLIPARRRQAELRSLQSAAGGETTAVPAGAGMGSA